MGAYLRTDATRDRCATWRASSTSFPVLAERRAQVAGTLSGGEQQMLAIGRALMSRPKLILFDEPSLGLAPNIVERTFEIIQEHPRAKARRCSWSSRTPMPRSNLRPTPIFSNPGRWRSKARGSS